MKKIIFAVCTLGLLVSSCNNKWDDHFDQKSGIGSTAEIEILDMTIEQFFANKQEYSKFYDKFATVKDSSLVKGSKVPTYTYQYLKDELGRTEPLTLWVANNTSMDAYDFVGISNSMKDKIMKYHINRLQYNYSDLKDGLRITTLSDGTLHRININEAGDVLMNYDVDAASVAKITKSYILNNATVHEVSEVLVPALGMYDYITVLPDNYSIIRDTILNRTYKKLNLGLSTPVGVNEMGQTVYDSVYDISNPLFDKVNIVDLTKQFTMLIPTDDAIKEALSNIETMYAGLGKTLAQDDYIFLFQWIKEAIFYNKVGIFAEGTEDIKSAYNRVWRTTVQVVDMTGRAALSNGEAFPVTKIKIPSYEVIRFMNRSMTGEDGVGQEPRFPSHSCKGHIWGRFEDINRGKPADQANRYDQRAAGETETGFFDFWPNHAKTEVSWKDDNNSGYWTLWRQEFSIDGYNKDKTLLPRYFEVIPARVTEKSVGEYEMSEMIVPVGFYDLYTGGYSQDHSTFQMHFNGDPDNDGTGTQVMPNNIPFFKTRTANMELLKDLTWVGAYMRTSKGAPSYSQQLHGTVEVKPMSEGNILGKFRFRMEIPEDYSKYQVKDKFRWRFWCWSLYPSELNY